MIFHSYVSSPEGNSFNIIIYIDGIITPATKDD